MPLDPGPNTGEKANEGGDLFHVDALGWRTFAFALHDRGQVLLDEGRVVGPEVPDDDVVELVVTRIGERHR